MHLSFLDGPLPAGAMPLTDRAGRPAAPGVRAGGTGNSGDAITRATRRLVDAISAPHVAPGVALVALLAALLLGAVHALSPGHGKTLVGAYLMDPVARPGTPCSSV